MRKRLTKFTRQNIGIILIVLLATILRFYKLSDVPPSLNWDEVSHGYNAYSILKTGKDEWGKLLPIIFRAYGDYKLPVYIYLTTLYVGLFGLNAFAVRLPGVLAGVSMVIFTYLLVYELFSCELRVTSLKKKTNTQHTTRSRLMALTASFLVAIEPWSFFLSRGAFEANLAQAFVVAGVYFFVKAMSCPKRATQVEGSFLKKISRQARNDRLVISTIFLGLSVWTYNSARVFVPLLLLGMILIYKKQLLEIYKKKKFVILNSLFIILIFFLPMFFQLINPTGQARYGWVAILDEGAIGRIIEARNTSNFSPTITRLVYNRPTFFVSQFVKNYLSHISGNFLFFKGGSHYQFSVPNVGLLYPVNLFFLLIGVFLLLKKRDKASLLLLLWFYLAPIPSSLTRESPHALRAITFLPIPMILSAIGLSWFLKKFQGKARVATTMIYIIVVGLFFVNYLNNYFGDYRKNYSWSWQYGHEQVVDYVKENYDKYDKIIVTKKYGEPHEFFLFHWPWEPAKYQKDPNLIRFNQSNWYWVDRFDKLFFVNDWEMPKEEWEQFKLESGEEFSCRCQKCLLITSPDNYPKGWSKLETINFLDKEIAFEILEN